MWFLNGRWRGLILCLALSSGGCSDGLLGGAITAQFTGISRAVILGPETVSIDWKPDTKCDNYQIYSLSSSTTESLFTASVPPVILRYPLVSSERSYNFAVGCIRNGLSTGLDVSVNVSTWREFDGNMGVPESLPGGQFRLSWDYLQATGTKFLVYAIESTVPGIEQKLTRIDPSFKGYKKGYFETPVCVTFNTRLIIGPGGDCDPGPNLLRPGSLYQFRVVAQYPDNNHSDDVTGNYQSKLIDSTFSPPACNLTQRGLGADESSTYLYLRCSPSSNTSNNACPFQLLNVKAFQGVNGVKRAASDTLTLNPSGSNLLEIQAVPGQNALNDRLVENLEVEFTCNRPTGQEKSTIRYDGSQLKYPKPVLKFGTTKPGRKYELPPDHSYLMDASASNPVTQAPSKFGAVTATGDFDCDGKPDLAVGMPEITLNEAPYFNEAFESGAVKVYYNYTQTAGGTITAANGVQFLSFRNLVWGAHFGASLSSGNINRDVFKREGDVYYSCDDLIIGAPADGHRSAIGRAFIFFGQPQKFPQQPLNFENLAKNNISCGGDFNSSTCAPVELTRDMIGKFRVNSAPGGTSEMNATSGTGQTGGKSIFGYKVAYVRDFNADGFGDVVVTDPNCIWDGYRSNNGLPYGTNGDANTITEVGCFYLYFGGPSGIQSTLVAQAPDSGNPFFQQASFNGTLLSDAVVSPFIKVYPPIVQAGMHFGASISGGGDIDGKLPVPVSRPGGGVILANGDDFIVGAPDFSYKYNFNSVSSPSSLSSWTIPTDESASTSQDPLSNQSGTGNAASPKNIPPLNRAWAPSTDWGNGVPNPTDPGSTNATKGLFNSTGVAFAYLGRHAHKTYSLKMRPSEQMKFFPLGSLTIQSDFLPEVMKQFSLSVRDRQNGSGVLAFDEQSANISDSHISPIRSFYNCGVRGSPKDRDGSNFYEHFSCLAGRNNFSVIFPPLRDTETAVNGFGSHVSVLGAKEQNSIALYNLKDDLSDSAFVEPTSTVAGQRVLMYQAQGNVHDRIRGTPLWEVGVSKFNADGTLGGVLTGTSLTGGPGNATSNQIGLSIRRAAVNETLIIKEGATSLITSPNGGSRPQTDVNRDGYADVAVSTLFGNQRASIFTFFGNHAADFAYTYKNANLGSNLFTDSGASCMINRPTLGNFPTGENATSNVPGTGAGTPYTIYSGRAQAFVGSKNATLTAEFPSQYIPSTGAFFVAYLNQSSTSLGYATRAALPLVDLTCKPQVRHYSSSPTSLSAADLDNDGITDLATGFSSENTNQGKAVAILGAPSGIGLTTEQVFTLPEVGAKFGASVVATHWRFIVPVINLGDLLFNESYRRDLWVGAPGLISGSGGLYNFSAGGSGVLPLPVSITAPFRDQSNTPNDLNIEFSRIIGDINGDGHDEIWVPIKRTNISGDAYYDAMIYFGSAFGSVTQSFCRENLSKMSYQNGGALNVSASECLGSTSSMPVYLGSVQIRLPQYIQKATPLSGGSLIWTYPAGDVNKDGRGDVVVFDSGNLHLFFGAEGGIVNGQPMSGPASNRAPQWVSDELPLGDSTWSHIYSTWDGSSRPLVHGDFNGDGHEDLAIGRPTAYGARFNGIWLCSPSPPANSDDAGYCSPAVGPSMMDAGDVAVMYGGPYGYQVPQAGQFGFNNKPKCGNFLSNCAETAASALEVYGTLSFNATNDSFSIDSSKLPCDPSGTPGENCSGRGTIIRNPNFYNLNYSFRRLANQYFGGSLAAGDFNGDGIVDLAVGAPEHYLRDFGDTGFATLFGNSAITTAGEAYVNSLYGNAVSTSSPDKVSRGSVFIYYGSKGGLIAPDARKMLGDNGLALYKDGIPKADPYAVAFAVSPPFFESFGGASAPELDPVGSARSFGISIASGDYNGDTVADLAVTSRNGQLYIIHGPICGIDNARQSWLGVTYSNHNSAMAFDSSPAGTAAHGPCKTASFNRDGSALLNFQTSDPSAVTESQTVKALYPQMIYIDGVQPGRYFGSTLISSMPRNGGNIDGDSRTTGGPHLGTSDLIIGTYAMSDSNVTTQGGKSTGMAYVLFGHKAPESPDDMQTTAGLYVKSPSYNLKILSVTGGNFYRSPLILRPYETDGSVNSFFENPPSLGDLNGDLTGDLLLPTADLHRGGDQSTKVISGGGFKLYQ